MRIMCKVCGDFRSHNKDPESEDWICQVCGTHRDEPKGLSEDVSHVKDNTI